MLQHLFRMLFNWSENMKRIIFIMLDILSGLFLIGAYVIQYFTKRKLGMSRWVVYHQMKYQKMIPVDLLKYVSVILLFFLVLFIVRSFCKQKNHEKIDTVMIACMLLLFLFYLGFTMVMNVGTIRSYYLALPLIGLAVVMQIIRNLMVVCTGEK